jgi:Fe-S cluster assembly protein SufD
MTSAHPFFEYFANSTDEPGPVPALRAAAKEQLLRLTPPTSKTEEFRFFKLSRILDQSWSAAPSNEAFDPPVLPEAAGTTIVLRNGVVMPGADALPVGAHAGRLSDLPEAEQGAALDAIGSVAAAFGDDPFLLANGATFGEVVCVVLGPDVQVDRPIRIVHIGAGDGAHSAPRVVVVASRGAKATVVEDYVGQGEHFTNAVTEVIVGESANLHHVRVQREGETSRHVSRVAVRVGRFARYDSVHVTLGALSSRNDIWISHDGEDGWSRIDGLAMVHGEAEADTHSVIDNTRMRCESHQLHKCVVDDQGHAVFNGKIFVRHGAQNIDAYQLNRNLLLSRDARVDTKPQLEILADDVQCTHGATVGQLDDEQLFYLRSRGLSPEQARSTLTYAFAAEVIDSIGVKSLAAELERIAHERTIGEAE